MSEMINVNVDFPEGCITFEDGDTVFIKIFNNYKNGKKTVLNFADVQIMVTAWFNGAIGQLYRELSKEEIEKTLNVVPDDNENLNFILNLVHENSEIHYASKKK